MAHFHISSDSANVFQLSSFLDAETGRILINTYNDCQRLTDSLQAQPDPLGQLQLIKPWLINGHALIHIIYHRIFQRTFSQPNLIWDSFHKKLSQKVPAKKIENTQQVFQEAFQIKKTEVWKSTPQEEMLYLWIANQNPALFLINKLISDQKLAENTAYLTFIEQFREFTPSGAAGKQSGGDFISFLMEPIRHAPNDLLAQMEFIRTHWQDYLEDDLLSLLNGMDFIREEEKSWFSGGHVVQIPDYKNGSDEELENFTEDKNWMPKLVLIAKNIHVWLHQLSKSYQREIRTLDEIPDETLQELASRGFSGLWLIGVWERSSASAVIKRLCGNPEALASAYSLADYHVANDLGGTQAFENLKYRASKLGIRMGTDMVPNHMGLDSTWVKNHPDWFISLDTPPYSSYTFHGQNLSSDPTYNIQIEDHYYERTDAAVVFRYQNYASGETRYIYHGNDGTSMPWNDTAQLNYMNAKVREEVIQTILNVARLSPIIRFDAAMILTKRHYQRLWFPSPGHAGDIPSRAGRGMSDDEFNRLMPVEFWREVVDRIAAEVPDTLLLAEAFWLMESYFVRTLGMHRVYNSAFMHLLRDEDNQNFLTLIRNTLEYNPEILKRYVNFMNNPDEETAVQQFSKEDKYFGVCTMLATFPGLPMFGHGQIEGFSEKYGMEYRQAYLDETPDLHFLHRHEQEIFPLLKRRGQFSEVANFHMFDFHDTLTGKNENVYVYSNRVDDKRSLVYFHNKYAETQGWIHYAWSIDSDKSLTLAEALALPLNANSFVIFKDQSTNLRYIRKTLDLHEHGFFVSLGAYKYHTFLDFRIIAEDISGFYQKILDHLNGKGTPSIELEAVNLLLAPLKECASHHPIYLLDQGPVRIPGFPSLQTSKPFADKLLADWHEALSPAYDLPALQLPTDSQWKRMLKELDQQLPIKDELPLSSLPLEGLFTVAILTTQILAPILSSIQSIPEIHGERFVFGKYLLELLSAYGLDEEQKQQLVKFQLFLLEWTVFLQEKLSQPSNLLVSAPFTEILSKPAIQSLLQVNTYQEITWFHRESYYIFVLAGKVTLQIWPEDAKKLLPALDLSVYFAFTEKSQYKLEALIALFKAQTGDPA
jgi:glycosidase